MKDAASNINPYKLTKDGKPMRIQLTEADFSFEMSPQTAAAIGSWRPWSVLVVMAADCNLSAAIFHNLLDLKNAAHDQAHICAFFDGPIITDTFFLHLNEGTLLTADFLQRYLDLDMTNPKYLREILTNHRLLFPADHHLLILSGHGGGYAGIFTDEARWKTDEMRQSLSLPQNLPQLMDTLQNCNILAIKQMQEILKEKHVSGDVKSYDIVALDACSMGSLEVLGFWSEFAEILVASELPMPEIGYPYGQIIGLLKNKPQMSPSQLAQKIASLSQTHLAKTAFGKQQGITQIVVQKSFAEAFSIRFGALIRQCSDLMTLPETAEKTITLLDGLDRMQGGYVDLMLLLQGLKDIVNEPTAQAIDALLNFIQDSHLVLYITSPDNPYLPKGLSIYLPQPEHFSMDYLNTLAYLPEALVPWSMFLGLYYVQKLQGEAHLHPLVARIIPVLQKLKAEDDAAHHSIP